MGRMAEYQLDSTIPVGVILKGHTRISAFEKNTNMPYLMSYSNDLGFALETFQYWRSNPMMIDSTSMSRHCADYNFPPEGVMLYFFLDPFLKPESTTLCIHTEIGTKGDGF